MPDARSAQADALLEGIARERRGAALKVFLGAAPGVGKTYAMLSAARELKRRGIDVVVGIVETHGRAETAALLEGLEVLPRRRVEYRDRTLEELDLDALLARKPKVALIDELAHSNAPGSRHPYRYQDVLELLDAGIEVYTTVNIQHLESQNDLVERLTQVRVRETVPDAVFDRARDIVLVDLPPRELIERLQQGKVYVPELASSALQRFFNPSNLSALRELALQQISDRVDADLRETLTARGQQVVPIRRRLLVAVDGSENSEYLVRVARKLAERRGAPWTVAFVDTGDISAERRHAVDQVFALARRLGAETDWLRGADVADTLLDHAAQQAVSGIVLGRTRERPFARMFNRTLTQRLLQHGAHLELTILATPQARRRARRRPRVGVWRWSDVALAAGGVVASLLLALLAERWLALKDLSPIFLLAVLVVAVRTRGSIAVLTAVSCFLGWNFFFTEPRYTLAVWAHRDFVNLFLFLVAALISGRLAGHLRRQVLNLRAANASIQALQSLGRELATAADAESVLAVAQRALARAGGCDVVLFLRESGGQLRQAAGSATPGLTEQAAADWTGTHGKPAGRGTDTLQASAWWFLPLKSKDSVLGVAGLRPASEAGFGSEQEELLQTMVDDLADALARTRLNDALEAARMQSETENLRAALLSSVSHDLRSPLSAIVGAAESLTAYGDAMPPEDRRSLQESILGEGQRLDRYIQNLLDMTRLGHGELKIQRDWIAPAELLGAAARRVRKQFPGIEFALDVPPDLPLLWVHPALVEQAVFNILENAARFSPPGGPVSLRARADAGELRIEVADRGPGIPEEERARIFDMFYSVARGDRGKGGTGLGLSICQGLIGAHGGRVEALPGADGCGTLIVVTLPLTSPPEAPG
ncbi:MAG: sensor histidine kinase KdpD [Rhodanobacteraceae bacterium]|nr:sensor histidine kinase KdpD [Rhodanobacteraceae bacterium]